MHGEEVFLFSVTSAVSGSHPVPHAVGTVGAPYAGFKLRGAEMTIHLRLVSRLYRLPFVGLHDADPLLQNSLAKGRLADVIV